MKTLTALPKIIFFDIDGTLYINHGEQRIPESAKYALRLLKQQGIITAIATGRSISVLPERILEVIEECEIDMIVSINGQYVQYRQAPLASFPMSKSLLTQMSTQLCQHQVAHAFVTHEGLFTVLENEYLYDAMRALNLPYMHDPQAHKRMNVYQLLVFYPQNQDAQLAALLPKEMQMIRWHENGVDWLVKQGSKARGIEAALAKLGLNLSEAMAFGDALNDQEMLQMVGFGVAMGNADPAIKAIADYVCPPIDQDGIYRGLLALGVLKTGE